MSVLSRRTTVAVVTFASFVVACAPAKTVPDPPNTPKPAVTSADLRNPNEPIEQVLQRKVPGLQVTRIGGEIALQIRGTTSYNGKQSPPMYVLNGLRFSPGPGGVLTGINPEDIETVKILRGADATIYGMDGANGVIVITTKKGGK
jgi:TonB-dependent SusC/RagA subfamily outer membrane receptor